MAFANTNPKIIEQMEKLKLTPGGGHTFEPANAHHKFLKESTAIRTVHKNFFGAHKSNSKNVGFIGSGDVGSDFDSD
jgi:hypothetical protein